MPSSKTKGRALPSAGLFETLGILLGIVALSVGEVVIVSPIIAPSQRVLVGTRLFLRGMESSTLRTY